MLEEWKINLKVATCEFTTPVQVLFNASKVFEGVNIKKEVTSDLLSCLAPQVGGEIMLFYAFSILLTICKYTIYQLFIK